MKNSLFLPTLAGALFLAAGIAFAETREWTQADSGKKIQAEYVGLKDEGTVTIKMSNGKTFDIPLNSLSQEDQDFVKAQNMADAPKEGKGGKGKAEEVELPEGEVTVVLSGVHMCCRDCEEAVPGIKDNRKISWIEGIEMEGDKDAGTITIKAPSGKAMMSALEAVEASGFYGTSDHEVLKIEEIEDSEFGASIFTVTAIHLCCGQCVKDIDAAVMSVEGVTEHTAEEGKDRFFVKGDNVKPSDVMKALRAAGFGGVRQ